MSDVPRDSAGVLRRHLLTMQLDRAREGFALAAPKGQCDRLRAGSSSRELAAKVALDNLAAFRPHSPFFSEEATEQSCATLMEASE